ncbi:MULTISPECIES: GspE/PulE family protein [Limibacillus]|jgi:general secretion pathway protein E|uniref:General secretion pathway protein E n=1 Tax=Limibacillus halophilus TaxID=1579333 RepID=A0A839SUS9_9PROT|nr:ATPase, T2SS/T4P/T4SS family [Limibacillus halophilus]MBB3064703.1 general secretion pathway protein E [Limibacillus halophilus]
MKPLEQILADDKVVPLEVLEKACENGNKTRRSGTSLILALRRAGVGGSRIAAAVSRAFDLPLASLDDQPNLPVLPDRLSANFLKENSVLPLSEGKDGLRLAVADPGDRFVVEAVRIASGLPVALAVSALEDIETGLERLYGPGKSALERIVEDIGGAEPDNGSAAEDDIEHLKDAALEAPVIRLVNQIISDAVQQRASDIHIEPFRDSLKVRYRIDGLLQEISPPPLRLARVIISRIKILAGLNIAERRLPQDGRVRLRVSGRQLDLRVSSLPTTHGESVVIRLLDDSSATQELPSLGLLPHDEGIFRRNLKAPYGMIIVTGPTGSGKTTTLGAALRLLNEPHRKILTAEDPIEYQIPGINQVQVKPAIGMTFANALRAFVRQDPDVIMVGEMRDGETAEMAVHAALTGHLLLTTLHTNNAAGAITRLVDMGVDSFLIASTLRLLIGQRLVRVLCPECSRSVKAGPQILEEFRRAGLTVAPDGFAIFEPVGCDSCQGNGFIGRKAIFELLEVDETIQRLITPGVTTNALQRAARDNGMTTMLQDGLEKCRQGVTTIEEVRRVTEDM